MLISLLVRGRAPQEIIIRFPGLSRTGRRSHYRCRDGPGNNVDGGRRLSNMPHTIVDRLVSDSRTCEFTVLFGDCRPTCKRLNT